MHSEVGSPTAPDSRELVAELRHVQEELRVVYDAIDELREAVAEITRGYREDDWQPIRHPPLVSFPADLNDPNFRRKINQLDPQQLPAEWPANVRASIAARLRESHGEDVDSLAEPHRPDDRNGDTVPVPTGTCQQMLIQITSPNHKVIDHLDLAVGYLRHELVDVLRDAVALLKNVLDDHEQRIRRLERKVGVSLD